MGVMLWFASRGVHKFSDAGRYFIIGPVAAAGRRVMEVRTGERRSSTAPHVDDYSGAVGGHYGYRLDRVPVVKPLEVGG